MWKKPDLFVVCVPRLAHCLFDFKDITHVFPGSLLSSGSRSSYAAGLIFCKHCFVDITFVRFWFYLNKSSRTANAKHTFGLPSLFPEFARNVKVWCKKHAWELFQYSSVLFDNRFELNNDLKVIVEMTRPNKHQSKTIGQIVELPCNFMHCSVKFQHATQTFGKWSPFLAR